MHNSEYVPYFRKTREMAIAAVPEFYREIYQVNEFGAAGSTIETGNKKRAERQKALLELIESSEPIKLKDNIKKLQAKGRGGTDLNPVLKYTDDFDFTIIITDGYMPELQTTLRQERTTGILFVTEEIYEEHIKSKAWNKFLCGFVRAGKVR